MTIDFEKDQEQVIDKTTNINKLADKIQEMQAVQRALEMSDNTAPFDITHHPAMALPCGMSEDLPISLMLIGKHFDETTIYRAAHGFQEGTDWEKM